jgi:DNA helicase-2/ATP-dependent DNA helicase PcrA
MQNQPEVEEALSAIGQRDHSVTAEYRIFGPPGTGKTTNLARQIHRAVHRFGEASVLVTSFSRAAAAELARQDLPISSDRIGTLHSHCWHALGRPEIAEANVEDWNRLSPHQQITPAKKLHKLDGESSEEDVSQSVRDGDRRLSELNRARGMLLPEETWPATLRDFAAKWSQYKKCSRTMDFCDLIETAGRELAVAPSRPSVIFADEAQDLNPMQLRLVRRWGDDTQYFILAADDDQTIYSWCGATPDAVLDPPIPEDHKITLKQSYRLPRKVHELANRLIHQVSRRQAKLYEPRSEDGLVFSVSQGGYKSPEYWILKTVMQHLERGEKIMMLASCSYMLNPVVAVLRNWGIPFHNPYRKANGFWNPLRLGRNGSSANRILSLLIAHPDWGDDARPWTYRDLKAWATWLRSTGILRPEAGAQIEQSIDSALVMPEQLPELFEPGPLKSLLATFQGDYRQLLEWWHRRLAAEFHSRVKFPMDVTLRAGPKALNDPPKVIVGTIHSVKGGEADVVFLFPDVSPAAAVAYQRHGPERDSVIRLFYVGVTRARKTLYICQRESSMAVKI